MKTLHIALSVADLQASITDYTQRLGAEPIAVAPDQYALWRTPQVNLSISQSTEAQSADQIGILRHLGFEDPDTEEMSESNDVNGLL